MLGFFATRTLLIIWLSFIWGVRTSGGMGTKALESFSPDRFFAGFLLRMLEYTNFKANPNDQMNSITICQDLIEIDGLIITDPA